MSVVEPTEGPGPSPLIRIALLVPDASITVARGLGRSTVGALQLGAKRTASAIDVMTSPPIIRRPLVALEARVESLAQQASEQRHVEARRVSAAFVRAEPRLTEFLERIVDLLPIDALLARIDLNALLARIDLDHVVSEVLAGIEIGDLIHDSTNSVVSDLRDTVRSGAVTADSRVARIIDRIVRGGREREQVLPGYATPMPVLPVLPVLP